MDCSTRMHLASKIRPNVTIELSLLGIMTNDQQSGQRSLVGSCFVGQSMIVGCDSEASTTIINDIPSFDVDRAFLLVENETEKLESAIAVPSLPHSPPGRD